MVRAIIRKLSSSVIGGAFIIGLASIISRVIGLVRDNLLARQFAHTATIDIYNAAFKVPDLLFNILVLGALSASFIPVFIAVRSRQGDETAFRTANAVLNWLLLGVCLCVVIGFIIAPWLAHWFMAERPIEQQQATALLMRVMLSSIIFFAISNVASGILNSYRRFIVYSLAPIMYNIGIIAGIIWFYPRFGLIGLGYGVVAGAAAHMLVQLPMLWQVGFRYQPTLNWSLAGVRKIFTLMPPRALALGVVQLNATIIAMLTLRFPEGSLGTWTWADNLQQFPINVFGVSLALSAFPVFSQAFADQDVTAFKEVFSKNFRRILFLIIPISIVTLLLRAQIVRLILGSFDSGRFDWPATIATAQVLGFFSVSMFAQATIPLLARSFFAHQDTKTPVVISLVSMILNIGLAVTLGQYLGLYGLALAYSIAGLANMLLLLLVLRLKFGDLGDRDIVQSVWRVLSAALVMGIVIQASKYAVAPWLDMRSTLGVFIQTSVSVLAGGIIYTAIAWYYKFDEVDIIKQYMGKLRRVLQSAIKKT